MSCVTWEATKIVSAESRSTNDSSTAQTMKINFGGWHRIRFQAPKMTAEGKTTNACVKRQNR